MYKRDDHVTCCPDKSTSQSNQRAQVIPKQPVHQGIIFGSDFLAARTNGRGYATVLHLSVAVVMSSLTLCIVAKRCVLEQKLLLTADRKSYSLHEKSIGTKMNDIDLYVEVV